jgi:hypothetical protein
MECQSRDCGRKATAVLLYRGVQGGEAEYQFCEKHVETRREAQRQGHERHGRPGPWWKPSEVEADGNFYRCPWCDTGYYSHYQHENGERQERSCDGQDGCGRDFTIIWCVIP